RSPNPEATRPFTIWLNCSTTYLNKQQAAFMARNNGKPSPKIADRITQFTAIEAQLAAAKQQHPDKLKLKYLKASPLVLEV
ncbi:MAG: hypothetical protein JNK01_18705, partial [Devosia sp.]|nr:hypothetical protein [Devosia sp.]